MLTGGCSSRGGEAHARDGDSYDRRTGTGYVPGRSGHYSDGLAKGHRLTLLVTEPSGACAPRLCRLLRALASLASEPGADTTAYGSARCSPASFYQHHLSAISAAVVRCDTAAVITRARSLAFLHTLGAVTAPPPPGREHGRRHAAQQ